MKCRNCSTTENLNKAGHRTQPDGTVTQRYMCRDCNAEKKRKERKRNPSYLNRATATYRKKFPERHNARLKARAIPLQPCEVCGADAVRHHPDWSKPLEVVFLCYLHHKQVHAGAIPCPK